MVLTPDTPDEQARLETLMAKWPTTDAAWGCMNCRAIFRELDNARCPHCQSEACFDVAALINRPSVSVERLRPIVDALGQALEEAVHE